MRLTDKQKAGLREAVKDNLKIVKGLDDNSKAAVLSTWIIGVLENQDSVDSTRQ